MKPAVTADNKNSDAYFPIVGIGASAGGLNALECFIAALPREFGFAVVFVQHLSTKHKSLLPELLHTQRPDLRIEEISDGREILPGRIYLCRPGQEIRIEQGAFRTAPPPEGHVHVPIDEFFESLAEEAGERVTVVVFSGAGTDGSRGIKTVRAMGGTIFVQDPETAEFTGMPLSSINTGHVDRVLPPADIAREIVKTLSVREETVITPLQIEAVLRVIHEKTGHRFNHYKNTVISRRISRRMYLHGIASAKDYLDMVSDKDAEAAALASDMMIGVTSFFRDRVAWKALKMEVISKLASENKGAPIRVWSPACATGEEAYSVAMMLSYELELAGRNREVQVFATDVNDSALEKAREGMYPGSIAADVPADYMRRFFACSEDGISLIVNKELREKVVFARQDLLTDPPFSRLDLIICRNFLIYLDPDAQEKCIAIFHYALKTGGHLFLGNAESANRNSDFFKPVGHKKCRVYRKVEAEGSSRMSLTVPFAEERTVPKSLQPVEAADRYSFIEFIQDALLEKYAPAAVAIDENYNILYNNGPTNRYLRQPRGVPTQNLLELLSEKLRSRVRGGIYRVINERRPVSIRAGFAVDDGSKQQVILRVSQLRENLFLVVFRQKDSKGVTGTEKKGAVPCGDEIAEEAAVRQLESELSATRQALQSNIEQLKSLNEEQQSSNEELYAANEELETSREELQSLNEELITVNSQLQSKIEEQEETNNDLNNFLASTNIPTVFLDHQLQVRRFTPAMSRLIKLIPGDVGRPIADMSQDNLGPDLIDDSLTVLDHLSPIKKEVMIGDAWYIRAILPYRTLDNRIEGVVVTYTDTSELKRAEERTRHLASFPQLDPNPVIEVDSSGKIIFLNAATREVLEKLGLDKEDCSPLFPADFEGILKDLGNKNGNFRREVTVKDRVFGESVHLVPQSGAVRIYAFDITERKRDEEMRGRLSAIVQSAEDAIISKDLDGVIQTWNVGAEKIFGYAAEEVIGKNISLLIPPGHVDEVPGILRRISQGEHIERYETERMKKDGKIIPVSLTYSPIRDVAGRVVGVSKIAHDISDRKAAEEALRESEGRLRAALESAEMGTWDVDVEHGTVDWDVRCRTIFGLPELEVVPLDEALARIVEEDRERVRKEIAAALETSSDGKYDVEYRVIGIKDRLRWIRATGQTFYEGSGDQRRAKRFIGVVMDMTGRRKAEEAIRQSEEQFRTVADAIPQLCWTADPEGYITWYNRRWYEYTGTTPDQMEGWGWQSVHDPEILPAVMDRWKSSIATGEPFEMEFPLRGADGTFRPFLTRILPLKDSEGRVIKWFGTSTDISELKRAETALLHAKQDEERHAAQLQTIVDNLTEGLVVADLDANLFHWNPAAVAIHGFSSVEECRRKLPEFADIFELSTSEEGILPLDRWPLARILEGETLHDWEVYIRRPGTEWERVFSYGGTLARDRDGKPLLAVITVADVTERKRAETEFVRVNKALKALSDSSQAIIRAKDEPEYMNRVCSIITEDCGYDMVWIGLAEHDDAKSVRPVAHAGFEDGYLETLQVSWADTEHGRGPTGKAVRTGEIAVCRNMLTDPAFEPWRDEALRRGYASSIGLPLISAGETFGAVTIYSREADPFSEGEIKLLEELADNLAYGIEVLRIREAQKKASGDLKKSLNRFELLVVTAGELLQSTETQKVVESVCRKVMAHLDCDAFFNFLVDEQAEKLHLNAWAGIPEEEAKRIEWLDYGVAVCGCAARDASRIVAERIPTTPDERTELVKSYGISAYCCHPLLGPAGKVIGTLSFGTCNRETFSEEDLSLMKAVADQVATAMIRLKSEEDILRLSEDMAARNVELESVNRELESFIYSISHDLRAPLRSVGGFANILAEDYSGVLDDQGRDYLDRIVRGSEKMTLLIDDLLHLSKISREEVRRTEVDMSGLALSIVAGLRDSDPERDVNVAVAPDLTAFADPRLMEIVLSNLLSNAWKFTSKTEDARIEFGAFEEDGRTVFYVRDNGAGFDPEYMGKMFSPFQRLHSDKEYEGTGIGLTIVDRIVRRHGGSVWAEGGVGEGAAVYFTAGKY